MSNWIFIFLSEVGLAEFLVICNEALHVMQSSPLL